MQHFIQKAMHATPACRGTAADLLAHPWILTNTGQAATPHWAPAEPALAHSQIPRPPKPASATNALEPPARGHLYKWASDVADAVSVPSPTVCALSRSARTVCSAPCGCVQMRSVAFGCVVFLWHTQPQARISIPWHRKRGEQQRPQRRAVTFGCVRFRLAGWQGED